MATNVHFEIRADDPIRVIEFYSSLFGWEFHKWSGPQDYWLVNTGPTAGAGFHGGLARKSVAVESDIPSGDETTDYVCTVYVDSIADALAALPEAGGRVMVPQQAVPGVGWLAYVRDPERNIIGLMQPDPLAG